MVRILSIIAGMVFLIIFRGNELTGGTAEVRVPVLVYHRFAATATGSTTVTTREFKEDVAWLRDNRYTVIPLCNLVDFLRRGSPSPPPRAVVITVDDGHRSVWYEMLPVIRQYAIPVTLFIYPSAISNASYALTWAQLAEMQATGLVDIASHTYWHPNFRMEKKRLAPDAYEALVRMQLHKSKSVLERRLAGKIDLLAWPFGIYDEWLEEEAEMAGYAAAFTIERRPVTGVEKIMALPRYLVVSGHGIRKIVSAPKPAAGKGEITR